MKAFCIKAKWRQILDMMFPSGQLRRKEVLLDKDSMLRIFYINSIDFITERYPPIAYYWTVPLILDNSYLVGKSISLKIADTKVSGF